MLERMLVTPRSGKSFYKGVASAKSLHGIFDARQKAWAVRVDLIEKWKAGSETREEYLAKNHLLPIGCASTNAATTYRGQASMDAEDSIF